EAVISAAARRTIAETNAAWLEAMKRQDAAAIAAIYSEDAVFITAAGEALREPTAIENFERERFNATGRVVEGTIEDDGLAQTGQCVYEWGPRHITRCAERRESRYCRGTFPHGLGC